MYVCMYVRMYIQVSVSVCMYVRMHACMNVFMYALCAYVCVYKTPPRGPLWPSQAWVQKEGWWRGADTAAVKNRLMINEIQWQAKKSEWKTPRCGRRREKGWTPTRAKTQNNKT